MALPDFLIIGAPKAGSTALHSALAPHPQLFLSSVKEPKFFLCDGRPRAQKGPGDAHSVREWVWHRDRYETLFEAAPAGTLKGESTPFYLWDRQAQRRIRQLVPEVKLIAVLRDPVDRAYSNWTHLWCDGLEPEADFLTACEKEQDRVRAGWAPFWRYLELGRYGEQLEHLLSCFDASQVHLLRYRELVDDPSGTLDAICRFLGVAEGQLATAPSSNLSAWVEPTPANHILRTVVRAGAFAGQFAPPQVWRRAEAPLLRLLRRGGGHRPELAPGTRLKLVEHFRDDVAVLERLTGLNYSDWLGPVGRGTYSVRRS